MLSTIPPVELVEEKLRTIREGASDGSFLCNVCANPDSDIVGILLRSGFYWNEDSENAKVFEYAPRRLYRDVYQSRFIYTAEITTSEIRALASDYRVAINVFLHDGRNISEQLISPSQAIMDEGYDVAFEFVPEGIPGDGAAAVREMVSSGAEIYQNAIYDDGEERDADILALSEIPSVKQGLPQSLSELANANDMFNVALAAGWTFTACEAVSDLAPNGTTRGEDRRTTFQYGMLFLEEMLSHIVTSEEMERLLDAGWEACYIVEEYDYLTFGLGFSYDACPENLKEPEDEKLARLMDAILELGGYARVLAKAFESGIFGTCEQLLEYESEEEIIETMMNAGLCKVCELYVAGVDVNDLLA